jgi:cell division protein FtsQ
MSGIRADRAGDTGAVPTLGLRRRRRWRASAWRAVRFLARPRVLAALAAVALVIAGAWMWLRSSSVVAIRQVTIVGVQGPDAGAIRVALRRAARGMTTLNLDVATLRAAVKRYPEVTSVSASTEFPHGLVIDVGEYLPVAEVLVDGDPIYVSGDGTLSRGGPGPMHQLPVIPLPVPPGGTTLTEGGALAVVHVLAAAPWQMLAHIQEATNSAEHGVVVALRQGPSIYFGGPGELRAKWSAALAVIGSPSAGGASYIDVTDPQRPAAGVPTTASTTTPGGSLSSDTSTTPVG